MLQKEEFFDAVRRHICQILGFDFGFVDYARGHEITNIIAFSADDDDGEAFNFVESLKDEHNQPITLANTHVAQKVRQSEKPWVGKIFTSAKLASRAGEGDESKDSDGYPYAIVPIVESRMGTGQVRGLIRVISFDTSREIDQKDLSTLKLMGEHLYGRMPQLGELLEQQQQQAAEQGKDLFDAEYVLIVHSNRLTRRRYSRVLGVAYQVIEADTGERALELLQEQSVDLILLDSEVKGTSGYAFCKVLKESPEWKHIPVILIASEANPQARVEGLNVGADDCLSEQCLDSELFARAKSSLRHRKTERELAVQLQLLEDYAQRLEQATEHLSQDKQLQLKKNRELERLRWESDILRTQDSLLHRISNTIRRSFQIGENLQEMLEDLAGWFSLDCCFVVMPSEEEPEDSLRCEYATDDDYRVVHNDRDLITLEVFKKYFQIDQALIVNDVANDRRLEHFRREALTGYHIFSLFYIPISYEEKLLGLLGGYKCESEANWNRDNEGFLRSVADQVSTGVINARLYNRVQRQATTDGLTGLFNHRTGQEKLAEQLRLAERYQRNISVVMIDVDHFKSINDNYGHPCGDTVLKAVAKLVSSCCRDVDLPIRYGGEEFLLVLPEVNQEGAVTVAERIRKALLQEVIHHEDIQISVTASFGVSSFPDDAQGQQQLLDLADKALYLSKRLGRNQVHTAGDLMFEEIAPTVEKLPAPPPTPADVTHLASVSAEAEQKEELVPEVVEMVKALASALYSKSEYNKTHHLETARLAELLAKVMGLTQQQVEQIRVAGLLHDVGTLSLPSDLMNKQGPYTAEERAIINQHAVLGAQLLRPIRALKDICEILENHHERWDGTGYPRGLTGEQIPLPARIVSVVDSYHAMISDRPYRKAMTYDQALAKLKEGAGSQWDPFLVDIFIAVLGSLREPPGQ